MTIVSRRLVPFAAVLAVALTLAVWITASAGGWPQGSSPLPTMHFTAVATSTHYSLNGATQKNPVGATFQETLNFISSGKQIGRGFIAGTIVTNAGASLVNIEARFPHRGRVELQGVWGSGNNNTSAIIGGTGVFTTASGWAIGHNKNVTVTFR